MLNSNNILKETSEIVREGNGRINEMIKKYSSYKKEYPELKNELNYAINILKEINNLNNELSKFKSNKKYNNLRRNLNISVFLIAVLIASYIVLAGYSDCTIYGICNSTKTTTIINYLNLSYNSSDYWDNLDTPTDLDDLLDNYYVPYSGATDNIDLGDKNLTTTGQGQFSYVDKLEISEPSTPPANTLRLYVINQDGFPRFNYKDSLGVTRTINDDEIIVKNIRGTTIAKHRFVYVTGHEAGIPTVDIAKADNISTMPSICVTIESIANGSLGRCMMSGLITGVNTNAFDVGTIYVSDSTAGIPTNNNPISPNLTQEMGTILVKDTTVGEIQIISRALTGDEFGTINNFTVAEGNHFIGDGSYLYNVNISEDYIPQYMFSHTNETIAVKGVGTWTNITFSQEDSDIKQGISHTFNDNTNHTFTIMEDGIYNVDYDLDVQDTSVGASNINVAARLILTNGTEIKGSVFEIDLTKQGTEAEISHNFLIKSLAGDEYVVQFTASDSDVQVSTHGTYGDYPESATLVINKIANLP